MVLSSRSLLAGSLIFFCLNGNGIHYRSSSSGDWTNSHVWEVSTDLLVWSSASTYPDYFAESITIRSPTKVTYNAVIPLDEVVVEEGATLSSSATGSIYWDIRNGPGVDLNVQGILEDNTPQASQWQTGSRWELGAQASIVRSRSTTAVPWRDHYSGGIAQIPASSNWILLRTSSDHPAFTTASMYYGNLTFLNASGSFWDATAASSRFSGWTVLAPVIKGNLTIGNSTAPGSRIYVETPAEIQVQGNLYIGPDSELLLNSHSNGGAQGLGVAGDVFLEGKLSYNVMGATNTNRRLRLHGGQSILRTATAQEFWNLLLDNDAAVLQGNIGIANRLELSNSQLDIKLGYVELLLGNPGALMFSLDSYLMDEDPLHAEHFSWNMEQIGSYLMHFGRLQIGEYSECRIQKTDAQRNDFGLHTFGTAPDNESSVAELQLSGDPGNEWADRFWFIRCDTMQGILQLTPAGSESVLGEPNLMKRKSVWESVASTAEFSGMVWYGVMASEPLEYVPTDPIDQPVFEKALESYYCLDVLGRKLPEEQIPFRQPYWRVYERSGRVEKKISGY